MNELGKVELDEYEAYSDVLEQRLGLSSSKHPIVIRGYTTTGIDSFSQDLVDFLEGRFGIRDIQKRNLKPHQLENRFTSNANIILLSEEDIRGAALSPNGMWDWNKFRSEYDSAIYELSRVSFDNDHKLAHLCFGFQADYHMGYGCHFILENKQGKWTIKHELPAWKS
jgi:hypothetical protein